MSLYDEAEVMERIKNLHDKDIKNHLSHVVRNGVCCVLAAHKKGGDVERELSRFMERWRELGL